MYGANTEMPFSVHHNVDHPMSLYAATKKANELMAHTYSSLYDLPTTGLRFFTVYGPWGRPDMALFKFTKKILAGEPIDVFNYGNHRRDFTYIDDIIEGVVRVMEKTPDPNPDWTGDDPDPATSRAPWRVYNIGNNRPVELMRYIEVIEAHGGWIATAADLVRFAAAFDGPAACAILGPKAWRRCFLDLSVRPGMKRTAAPRPPSTPVAGASGRSEMDGTLGTRASWRERRHSWFADMTG